MLKTMSYMLKELVLVAHFESGRTSDPKKIGEIWS